MKQKESGRQFAFWLAGFVIGVLFSYFSAGDLKQMQKYMGMQNLMEIAVCQLNMKNYLYYLLRRRGLLLLVLMFAAMTFMGRYVLSAFLMFLGISMGTTAMFLLIHYGGKGILLFLALFFPQIICYVPAVYYAVRLLSQLHGRVFSEPGGRQLLTEKRLTSRQIFRAVGVTIIGLLTECYVNPIFVKFVIKFF